MVAIDVKKSPTGWLAHLVECTNKLFLVHLFTLSLFFMSQASTYLLVVFSCSSVEVEVDSQQLPALVNLINTTSERANQHATTKYLYATVNSIYELLHLSLLIIRFELTFVVLIKIYEDRGGRWWIYWIPISTPRSLDLDFWRSQSHWFVLAPFLLFSLCRFKKRCCFFNLLVFNIYLLKSNIDESWARTRYMDGYSWCPKKSSVTA